MIRTARPDDLRPIVRLAIDIFGEAFPFDLDEEHAVSALAMIMFGNGYAKVAEVDGEIIGFLVGTISVAGMWSRDLCGIEAKFGIHPKNRSFRLARAFVRDFEAWVKSMGVPDVAMVREVAMDSRVDRFYRRLGYAPTEVIYRKTLA